MIRLYDDRTEFEDLLRRSFDVLYQAGIVAHGVRSSGGSDPRDSSIVARFITEELQIEIGWNALELSLAILIKYRTLALPGSKKYIYFEPFIEFVTNGKERAIVPYITEKMNIRNIELTMDRRRSLFAKGLENVAGHLGRKLQIFLPRIESSSAEEISAYHEWMSSIT